MSIEYTLHKLPQGFIVSSDEEIKDGDVYYHLLRNTIHSTREQADYFVNNTKYDDFKKVIAQQPQIDFSVLKEEEQKEIGWFDVESEAERDWVYKEYGFEVGYNPKRCVDGAIQKPKFINGYKKGFQKAQELLSDRRFTLTDVEKAIQMSRTLIDGKSEFEVEDILGSADGTYGVKVKYPEKQIIQSISQPKSWKVELEMELVGQCDCMCHNPNNIVMHIMPCCYPKLQPKITDGKIKILKLCL